MTGSVQYWPGGIPCSIKPHPEADLSYDQIKEEVKGWLLFVQENWAASASAGVSEDDVEYKLHHRRYLVEKWASATQKFRDSYQSRAPVSLPVTEGQRSRTEPVEGLRYPAEALTNLVQTNQPVNQECLISIAPLDAAHLVNRARWAKFTILLYNYDIEAGHCLMDNHMPSEAVLNPDTTNTPTLGDFLPWLYLETADFRAIYLTHTGTVLYLGYPGPFMLVDEEGLKTGRLTMVEYEKNGSVKDSILVRPFNMRMPYMSASVLGKRLPDIRHVEGGFRHQNMPLDMDLPIIDILGQAQAADQLPEGLDLSDREQWMGDVELYAPGYLAQEAEGRAAEYPLHRLIVPSSVGLVKKRAVDRLRSDPRFNFFHPSQP